VFMTRGCGCNESLRGLWNERFSTAASRSPDGRKSMVASVESMARYR
jgi:hypothetical protein